MLRVILSVSTLLVLATATVQAKPTVYVVNYPLYYFTERVAGNHVEVAFPAPSDVDPAFWKPDIATVAAYQAADLIVINGATYAQWLSQVSLPRAKIVNTSQGFKAHYIAMTETSTHSHGNDGMHSHTGTASTTWLNSRFAAQQARAIAQALSRLLPGQRATFEANYAVLERDLLALDQRLSQGERQRVAICRALITRPALLLADEATGNLNPANTERMLKVLFAYVHDHQATLVAVTHDEALLAAFDTAIDLYHLTQPTTL
jgi:ABC-type Zn uptake system ZnuABC Zn-binding protein ZnuA